MPLHAHKALIASLPLIFAIDPTAPVTLDKGDPLYHSSPLDHLYQDRTVFSFIAPAI